MLKFKDLRGRLSDSYIILLCKDGRFEEFHTRSDKYDDYDVVEIRWTDRGIFVSVWKGE